MKLNAKVLELHWEVSWGTDWSKWRFCMNIIDVNVSPHVLGFQSFLSLGNIKLEGSLKLNYSNGQNNDLDNNMSKCDWLYFNIYCLNLVCTKFTSSLWWATVKYDLSFKVEGISMWRLWCCTLTAEGITGEANHKDTLKHTEQRLFS